MEPGFECKGAARLKGCMSASRSRGGRIDTTPQNGTMPGEAADLRWELGQPALEETPLRFLPYELEGAPIRTPRLGDLAETPTELGASGMRQSIVEQIAARQDAFDQFQPRAGAV